MTPAPARGRRVAPARAVDVDVGRSRHAVHHRPVEDQHAAAERAGTTCNALNAARAWVARRAERGPARPRLTTRRASVLEEARPPRPPRPSQSIVLHVGPRAGMLGPIARARRGRRGAAARRCRGARRGSSTAAATSTSTNARRGGPARARGARARRAAPSSSSSTDVFIGCTFTATHRDDARGGRHLPSERDGASRDEPREAVRREHAVEHAHGRRAQRGGAARARARARAPSRMSTGPDRSRGLRARAGFHDALARAQRAARDDPRGGPARPRLRGVRPGLAVVDAERLARGGLGLHTSRDEPEFFRRGSARTSTAAT